MARRAVLLNQGEIRIDEYEARFDSSSDCVVKVLATVVCSTDVRAFNGRKTRLDLDNPPVLGHEICGRIQYSGTSGIPTGEKVSVIGSKFCRKCEYCKNGQPLLCQQFKISCGGFSDTLVIPPEWVEWRLVHLDRDADVVAAAYLDSISCMVRAMRIATIKKGQRILVLGDGFMSQVLAKIIHLNDVEVFLMQETESFESSFSDTKYSILSVKEIFRKDEIKFDIIFDFGQYEKNKHDLTGLLAFGGKYVALSHRGSVVLHDLSLIYKNRYEFLHSYHSDLVDRECAKAYLPKLSTDLNKLSSAFPLDNTQDALEAVSKGNAIRCHINFSAL